MTSRINFISDKIRQMKKKQIIKEFEKKQNENEYALPCPFCRAYYPGDCGGLEGEYCCFGELGKCTGCRTMQDRATLNPGAEWE